MLLRSHIVHTHDVSNDSYPDPKATAAATPPQPPSLLWLCFFFHSRGGFTIQEVERCPTNENTHTHTQSHTTLTSSNKRSHHQLTPTVPLHSFHWHTTLIFIFVSDLNTFVGSHRVLRLTGPDILKIQQIAQTWPTVEWAHLSTENRKRTHAKKTQHVAFSESKNRKWIWSNLFRIFFLLFGISRKKQHTKLNTKYKQEDEKQPKSHRTDSEIYSPCL